MLDSQYILDLNHELVVDNFAGGGGASTGFEMGLGRHVDIAINHDRLALGMHRINHPQTVHHCEDVFDVDPRTVCSGRPVGWAHFSPDCKHFSKAKGGKPLDKRIRGLVLVMLRWAKYGARVLSMENVEEIKTWGPLKLLFKKGRWGWYPDPDHKGRTWLGFLNILGPGIRADHPDLPEILAVLDGSVTAAECVRGFGYHHEAREIRACVYGAPTIRKRLYMIARRDGRPIVWPQPTHAAPASGQRLKRWRTIAECIDWSLPCPSIFLQGRAAKAARCKRPLAKATLRRLAKGVDRFVLKTAKPFLVNLTHQGGERVESIEVPARTVTAAHRGEKALVAPVVSRFNGDHQGKADGATRNYPVQEPLTVQDTSNRFGLTTARLSPFLTEHANASNQRNLPADEPARTACAGVKGGHFAVVTGSLVGAGGPARGAEARPLDAPSGTVMVKDCKALAMASLMVNTSGHAGGAADAPSPTIPTGGHHAVVVAHVTKFREDSVGTDLDAPLDTVTAGGQPARPGTGNVMGLVAGTLVQTGYGERAGQAPRALDVEKPLGTVVSGGGKHAVVTGALVGAGGRAAQSRPRGLGEAFHTATAKADTCLAAVSMAKLRGDPQDHPGVSVDEPLHTISSGGNHGVVAAYLAQHNGGYNMTPGHGADEPSSTVSTTGSQQAVVAASIVRHFGESVGQTADAPAPTVMAEGGGKTGVVAASIAAYYGNEQDGQPVTDAARTLLTKPRLGLVESFAVAPPLTAEQICGARRVAEFLRAHGVQFEGEFATVEGFVIVDLGMRMLSPRELFRAQGFSDAYVIDRAWVIDPKTGNLTEVRLTKEQQIRMCGNSVCPPVAAALVAANAPELSILKRKAPILRGRLMLAMSARDSTDKFIHR